MFLLLKNNYLFCCFKYLKYCFYIYKYILVKFNCTEPRYENDFFLGVLCQTRATWLILCVSLSSVWVRHHCGTRGQVDRSSSSRFVRRCRGWSRHLVSARVLQWFSKIPQTYHKQQWNTLANDDDETLVIEWNKEAKIS